MRTQAFIKGSQSVWKVRLHRLCFGMFCHPALAGYSHSSGPQARETPQILVNPTYYLTRITTMCTELG